MTFGEMTIVFMGCLVIGGAAAFLWRRRSQRKIADFSNDALNRAQAYTSFQAASQSATVRDYKPENVGNDASARPWEYASGASSAYTPSRIPGAGAIPADFDAVSFLKTSKVNFVVLQQAWDRADIAYLRAMMTDDMLELIKSQLTEREIRGATEPKTEVLMLDAQLLSMEERHRVCWASVEFSGLIREPNSAGARPFRELWNMSKPLNGERNWLISGVQALH